MKYDHFNNTGNTQHRENNAGQSHLWVSCASTQQKVQCTTTVYQSSHWNITYQYIYFQWRLILWWGCHAVYVWDKERAFKGSSLHHNERFQILFGTACRVNRWQASCCLLKFPLTSFCSSPAFYVISSDFFSVFGFCTSAQPEPTVWSSECFESNQTLICYYIHETHCYQTYSDKCTSPDRFSGRRKDYMESLSVISFTGSSLPVDVTTALCVTTGENYTNNGFNWLFYIALMAGDQLPGPAAAVIWIELQLNKNKYIK